MQIRQAAANDTEFIIETIIEAEKSGSDMISSCKVLGLTEENFKEIMRQILHDNIPDYDYDLSGFLIAEKNDEYLGALGSWLEAADGNPSGIIKATILFPYLDKNKMNEISKNSKVVKGFTINRKPGALQLEHGYTREPYRRQGVFTTLIKEHIKRSLNKHAGIDMVQTALSKENFKSLNAYLKLGFEIAEEKHVDDPEILKLFPYDTRVVMELSKSKFPD